MHWLFYNIFLILVLAVTGDVVRPNFVFYFPDTIRAESVGAYGSINITSVSPEMDAFAKEAVTFEQCHVMHTQCSPSRATMLTGRYMHVLGHRTQIHLIRAYEENYFRILKNAGYHVAFFGKNDVFSQASFNFSVSEWQNLIGFDSGKSRFSFNESGYYSMLSTGGSTLYNDTKNGDYSAVTRALDFISNNPPEPFVLFLPTRGAHPP